MISNSYVSLPEGASLIGILWNCPFLKESRQSSGECCVIVGNFTSSLKLALRWSWRWSLWWFWQGIAWPLLLLAALALGQESDCWALPGRRRAVCRVISVIANVPTMLQPMLQPVITSWTSGVGRRSRLFGPVVGLRQRGCSWCSDGWWVLIGSNP